MITPITDHVARGLKLLLSQYQGAPNLTNLLTVYLNQVQMLEDAIASVQSGQSLSNAVGVQLDNLGILIGLSRPPGASDATYRQDLQAEVLLNVSDGTPQNVIQTFQLFTNADLVILDEYAGEVLIESDIVFPDQASINQTITVMQEVLPVAVRCDGLVEFDSTNPFAFDGALMGSGFGDVNDQTQGGLFANLVLSQYDFAFDGNDPNALGFGSVQDPLVGGAFLT